MLGHDSATLQPAVPGVAVIGVGVAPSLGISCFLRSVRTNKMAACCFYSSDTGGRVGGTATLGVKGRREGGGRKGRRGEVVFVGVRDCPETGSVLADFNL